MARLVVTHKDAVIKEFVLSKEKYTVGRKSSNDIVLDDPTVSGVHAVFIHTHITSIEDAGSTNGIKLNDVIVDKHKLIHGDIITIGEHEFKFIDEVVQNFEATVVIKRPVAADQTTEKVVEDRNIKNNPAVANKVADLSNPETKEKIEKRPLRADIVVMMGRNKGKVIVLNKPYTKLGSANQIAVIARRRESYYLMPMNTNTGAEESAPKYNGSPLGAESILLSDGDIIEVASTELKFRLKK